MFLIQNFFLQFLRYPYAPPQLWAVGFWFTCIIMFLRILYQLPLWCSQPFSFREQDVSPKLADLGYILACPVPARGQLDVWFGIRQTTPGDPLAAWVLDGLVQERDIF